MTALRALFGRRARLRWVHLVLGGALLMPCVLLASVLISPLFPREPLLLGSVAQQFTSYGVALPIAAASALFPMARPLSVVLARALCGVPGELFAEGPARSWPARLRSSGWYTLHLGVGALLSGMSLAVPPFALVLLVLPLFPELRDTPYFMPELFDGSWGLALAPPTGIALIVGLAGCCAAASALLARAAPALLGPTPADRLAAAEARAADLAVRNRLARELHDSVGHALSAVTLQASAARRVLESNPDFVREALTAIEDTTRRTVSELDAVLGLLRASDDDQAGQGAGQGAGHGTAPTSPAPTLAADLEGLLARTRAAGTPLTATTEPDLATLPPLVSREAYRIVQEGLSNALRHAAGAPVTLWIAVRDGELALELTNPLRPGHDAAASRPGGGSGLRGIGERARLLGGSSRAGASDGRWTLSVRLPLNALPLETR